MIKQNSSEQYENSLNYLTKQYSSSILCNNLPNFNSNVPHIYQTFRGQITWGKYKNLTKNLLE